MSNKVKVFTHRRRAPMELFRHKSFTAMAAALRLLVVSAWRQVRSLEDEFGVQLVIARALFARYER